MKLSSLILSMAVATTGVSADRLGAYSSPRTGSRAADRTTAAAMPHRHLKEEEGAAEKDADDKGGEGMCGQCKKADDCLPNYECVSAQESGCFNFDVSGSAETYCKPGPTAAPTVSPPPTAAVATSAPTAAPAAATAAPTATATSAPTAVIPAGIPTCNQCQQTDDCLPDHLCVTASESGCFNFDVSRWTDMYCAPVSNPAEADGAATTTVNATESTTTAPTSAGMTTAPTAAAMTTAPTTKATTTTTNGPTVAVVTTTITTPSPTPSPTVGTIRYIGSDPDIVMRVCEGDCDNDDDCEGDLVCFQRSGNDPVPKCGGTPITDKDYCVPSTTTAGRSSVVAAAQEAPSSGAGRRGLAAMIASGAAVVGAAVLSIF